MRPGAYVYKADLLCEDCGEKIRAELTKAGKAPANPNNEHSYDSDDFPKGPYPDGGGEDDTPQHCGMDLDCVNADEYGSMFLENPLTEDGYAYVKAACKEAHVNEDGVSVALDIWADFYDIDLDDDE